MRKLCCDGLARGKSRTRRDFFHLVSDGIYGAALTALLSEDLFGGSSERRPEATPRVVHDFKPRSPQVEPKAKAVIQLLMQGGPSQMDLFDPKPELEKRQGQPYLDKV